VISRICEEFGCLPSQAERELITDPSRAVITIMEMRSFARAKEQIDRHSKERQGSAPTGPSVELVHSIQYEVVMQDREIQRQQLK
jgi:hypothetical protein